ncbi:MAG: hypothetical protein KDJ47_09445 [Hyphomicrobiaceae bacterium]|nr:hypothetical protein [Hyphomicrobiaceae bacterium]
MKVANFMAAFAWIAVLAGIGSAHAEIGFVAGTAPDQRPKGDPTITQQGLSSDQRADALRGVTKPYPNSLNFLDDQGNWYTPFAHPGMTGPYDIRHLHASSR